MSLEKYPTLSSTLINCRTFYMYKDKFDRCWKLTPVTNEAIESPFVIIPIRIEEYNAIVKNIHEPERR